MRFQFLKCNKMQCALYTLVLVTIGINVCTACDVNCDPDEKPACGFDEKAKKYKMFANKCTMAAIKACTHIEFIETPLAYCIKNQLKESRRMYGQSCPVFCPNHYRPVCGASKYKDYIYRTFNNGCFLDMINCRGDDEFSGYVEVPLSFCQRHLMKNIFKERMIVSNLRDYHDYDY